MRQYFSFTVSLFFFCVLIGIGCEKTDNNDPIAPILTGILSLEKQFELPDEVLESSGLIVLNDQIITHNDSGDLPKLYQIDTTDGSLIDTIRIENTSHTDWEGITQSKSHIYVGDFGNNKGSRTDLKIYQVDNTNFEWTKTFAFSYENQIDFDPENEQHNFNMEAMIWMENQLYLFSKNHLNLKTYLYRLSPFINSEQVLAPIDSFDVNGLITDAAYWKETKQLALIGYDNSTDLNSFVYLFDGFDSNTLFGTTSHRFDLGMSEQIEGCTFINAKQLWMTSEKEAETGANLFELTFE